MNEGVVNADQLLPHIRVVLGIILGLSITTLLKGVASIIVHPQRYRWSWIHMSWVAWALVSVLAFWWWEFWLIAVARWTLESYLFIIIYSSLYFMLAALLFPEDVREYGSYGQYLLMRRRWFFGLIALIAVMDLADTALKGAMRWRTLGPTYPVHIAALLIVAGLGAAIEDSRGQLALALFALVSSIVFFGFEYFLIT